MKINKFVSLIIVPFLLACQKVPEYTGPKLVLDYVENGELIEINATQLYDLVITRGRDSVVLFTIEGCSACEEAKTDFSSYAEGFHMNLYTVDMTYVSLTSDDYLKIVNTTTYLDSIYHFPEGEELSFPLAYFYKQKGVALTRQTYFVDALRQYVTTTND